MRRLFTVLFIVLVVLITGLIALVLLVDPNDFRAEIAKQVANKSGYELNIEKNLRWHVWPQLSILAGNMTLTTPGAQQPVISAENIRLDVKLWPLLSHHLVIDQILLKGAVIRLMPNDDTKPPTALPVAPHATVAYPVNESHWDWNIKRIEAVDSVLIWQTRPDEQAINVRDLNFSLEYADAGQATLNLSSNITRDQRQLKLSFAGLLNHSAENYRVDLIQFDFQLFGADLPIEGIQGNGAFTVDYQVPTRELNVPSLMINVNNTTLQGNINASFLHDIPSITLALHSPKIDLDRLFGQATQTAQGEANVSQRTLPVLQPIYSGAQDEFSDFDGLTKFNATLSFTADQLLYRGINVQQLAIQADNQRGNVTLKQATARVSGGHIALKGGMAPRSEQFKIVLQSDIQDVELAPLLKAFAGSDLLTGKFTSQSTLSRAGTKNLQTLQPWQGNAKITLKNAKLQGLNLQQLIQQTARHRGNAANTNKKYTRYTDIQQLQTNATLATGGQLSFTQFDARSDVLRTSGEGSVNLLQKQCDIHLQVQVLRDRKGGSDIAKLLGDHKFPLRIFGPWDQLNYQVDVETLFKDQLQDRAKKALDSWLEKIR